VAIFSRSDEEVRRERLQKLLGPLQHLYHRARRPDRRRDRCLRGYEYWQPSKPPPPAPHSNRAELSEQVSTPSRRRLRQDRGGCAAGYRTLARMRAAAELR